MGYLNSVLSSSSQVHVADDAIVSGGGLRLNSFSKVRLSLYQELFFSFRVFFVFLMFLHLRHTSIYWLVLFRLAGRNIHFHFHNSVICDSCIYMDFVFVIHETRVGIVMISLYNKIL